MIATILIYVFWLLLGALTSVLPAGSPLPQSVTDAVEFFVPLWSRWSDIFPLNEVLAIVGLVISLEAAIFAFGLADWTYKKIRG